MAAACGGAEHPADTSTLEPRFTMYTPEIIEHPSGLTTIYVHNDAAPVVAVQVWVQVGSGDELNHEAGLAHVQEHMLFKGTEVRGVGEVARDIESFGGAINAWTSFDQTVYHIVTPSRFFGEGVDVLMDAIQNSVFEPSELERELEVIQEEIRRGEDIPTRILSQNLFSTAFGVHPYGRPVIGTSESVASFTRDDILSFYQRWYRPDNMTLVIVGDVGRDQVLDALDAHVANDLPDATSREPRPVEPAQTGLRTSIGFRDIQDAHLNLAFHTPELSHEDTPALELLFILLGQGESSVLFESIQRRQRLTTSVYSYLYSPAEPGMGMLGASFRGVDGPAALDVLNALAREVAHLRHRPVSPSDLERARTLLESDAIYQSQTVQGLAQRLGYFHVVAGGLEFEPRFLELARAVTPDDIQRVARRYFSPENLTVGFMLPESDAHEVVDHDAIEAVVASAFAGVESEYVDISFSPDANGLVRYQVPDGPTVIVQPDSTSPMFSVRAMAMGGLLAETPETNGINHVLAELLLSGTPTRDASEIAVEVDSMAASLAGFSGRNSLGMRMSALSRDYTDAMSLFADCLLNSVFPEDEVERVREETLAIIASQRDDLATSAYNQFHRALYGDHPYAMSVLGTEESVPQITHDALVQWHASLIDPRRLVISIVGDVEPEAAIRSVIHLFDSDADASTFEMPVIELAPPPSDAPVHTELRDRQQAHIVVGYPGISMFDPQRHTADILSAVLGGQGGRLFLELRDRQSLAYSVGAYATQGYGSGTFTFYIATSAEKIDQAIAGIREEVERLVDAGITQEELERAQRYLIGRRDIGLQRMSARASYYGFDELYGLGYDNGQGYADEVLAVTADDVSALIQRLFVEGSEVVSIVRPSDGEVPAQEP